MSKICACLPTHIACFLCLSPQVTVLMHNVIMLLMGQVDYHVIDNQQHDTWQVVWDNVYYISVSQA